MAHGTAFSKWIVLIRIIDTVNDMRLSPAEKLARDLDWNLLRVFLALAEAGSVTRAGERLGLKQPSVSQALKRLEERTGHRLIDRSAGSFTLTPEGMALLAEAQAVRAAILRGAEAMAEASGAVAGEVTLALASHVVSPLLDAALRRFHAAHPKATLSIDILPSREALTRLAEGQASLAICLMTEPRSDLQTEVFYREFFGLFCGPPHPLYARSGLTLADLAGHTAVSFQTDRMGDALAAVTELRQRAGLSGPVGQSTHLEEVRRMILAGLGIGPLPLHVVEEDLRAGRLWRLPPQDDPPAIDVYLARNPRARRNRAEAAFLAILDTLLAETPPEQRIYGP
ncbi:LysR family transcriptional regulator [Gemmobacter nanjingensis]|uniref:LysR family transcriptional regulator n=2 Tax=Gemmobacter nanjingensis TaxID=488454 RepID=A0ABQ3F744_9RHOB|nr:LysR family transcriptional regulator [Gemmobacter nanjingensis]